VLNTMVTMFSGYCEQPFTVEPVDVTDALGVTRTWPELGSRSVEVDMGYINARIGTTLAAEQAARLLTKMCLDTKVHGEKLVVQVPPTRSDVLHPCDIMEDVAIAYGYNNLVEVSLNFSASTISAHFTLNHPSQRLFGSPVTRPDSNRLH
jgi:phenylalanyl-tRNA synthetase beta chain